jgi:hypothetical protein
MNSAVPLNPSDQKVLDDVKEHGCHITLVFDDEGELPHFAYSTGFPISVGQPEVIVYGLDDLVMHYMINELHAQCSRGLTLTDGAEIHGLIEGHKCVARRVTNPDEIDEYFGVARWYHRSQHGAELVETFQIVWPGAQQGLFPWEPGCHEAVIERQPALYAQDLAK